MDFPASQTRALNVVLEVENLRLSEGTGIATYAATLASALRDMGHVPSGLIELRARQRRRNAVFDVSELDAPVRHAKNPVTEFLRRVRYWSVGDPLGAGAHDLTLARQMHRAGSRLGIFDRLYSVPHLGLRSELHFRRHGKLLRLKGIEGADVFHATQPIPLMLKGMPNISTIHDTIPLSLPHATRTDLRYHYSLLAQLARTADRIVTVSEFSRKDIISLLKVPEERVVNTYQSISLPDDLLELDEDEVGRRLENGFGLGFRNYFLFVGAIEPKKNIKRLIEGYAASGTARPLVLAGNLGWQYEDDVRAIEDERLLRSRHGGLILPERMVRHLGYVPRADLVLLLRGARALVFPSLYEGFGLPVLEAMLAATPVITSETSCLPEIAGDAAEYVDPYEPESISRAIRSLDQDDALCADLIAKGHRRAALFSPARYRERLASLYDSLR